MGSFVFQKKSVSFKETFKVIIKFSQSYTFRGVGSVSSNLFFMQRFLP